MFRTPPFDKSSEEKEMNAGEEIKSETVTVVGNPSGRLGSFTRKWNEIQSLIRNPTGQNRRTIDIYYLELKERVLAFQDSCAFHREKMDPDDEAGQAEFLEWEKEKRELMNNCLKSIEEWTKNNPLTVADSVDINDSVSNHGSRTSKRSRSSITSAASVKLLERVAEMKVQEAIEEEQTSLELKKVQEQMDREFREQEERLRIQQQKLKRQQELNAQTIRRKQEEAALESKKRKLFIKEIEAAMENKSGVSQRFKPLNNSSPNLLETKQDLTVAPVPASNLSEVCRKGVSMSSPQDEVSQVGGVSRTSSLSMAEAMTRALILPRNEPRVFDGSDCTLFTEFLSNFDDYIANKCSNDGERLGYLQKYTTGRPLTLVRSCQYENSPTERYVAAMKRLKEQYGDKHKIAQQFMKKVEAFPEVKTGDGQALEAFATILMDCKSMMRGLSPLQQLNNPREILSIILKLPFKLRENWRRRVHEERAKDRETTFADLAEFVWKEASICNTPMYESLNVKDASQSRAKQNQTSKKKSFSTKYDPQGRMNSTSYFAQVCLFCNKNGHSLAQCFEFARKPMSTRQAFVRNNNLCYGCLRSGHSRKDCSNKAKCSKCSQSHPTSLHLDRRHGEGRQREGRRPQETSTENREESQDCGNQSSQGNRTVQSSAAATPSVADTTESSQHATCATSRQRGGVSRRIVCTAIPVKVGTGEPGKKWIETYIALDGWSTESFMDKELLQQLGVACQDKTLSLATMGSSNQQVPVKVVNNLLIQSLKGDYTIEIPQIYAKDKWPFTKEDAPRLQDIKDFPYLKKVPFQFINAKIGILIGMNVPGILEPQHIISGKDGQPYATLHRLGWALSGPIGAIIEKRSVCHRTAVLPEETKDFFSTENKLEHLYKKEFQDYEEDTSSPSVEDLQWEAKVRSSIRKLSNGHYEIGLPFKDVNVYLPSNYQQAYSRLMAKKKSLLKKPDVLQEYREFMAMMLEAGYAEKVPEDQLNIVPGHSWFLVHFDVRHRRKGKIRIVFDCSLQYNGISLNQLLYQGPDLTSGLLSVLLKFRQDRIAFMADISKMFYQVRVPKRDSNFLRFLWYPDGNLDLQPQQYRLRVHVFGAVSSPSCSNYALRQVADDNEQASCEAKNTIRHNFYVDDLVKSVKDVTRAKILVKEVCELLQSGGFELSGFVSNSKDVLLSLPKHRLSKDLETVDLSSDQNLPYDRALGVTWKLQNDSLGFRINHSSVPCTKRGILSAIFSIYDPYGIAVPVILLGRSIFQLACHQKLQWDQALPPSLKNEWDTWWNQIPLLNKYSIDRCYRGGVSDDAIIQLHIFADGSEKGYAAVAYLRMEDQQLGRNCSLVMAKARLVPRSNNVLRTIPGIELNAAKLAVQLAQTLQKNLDYELESTTFWSDSTTVLKYISCETKRFQRFVANRVSYIRSFTEPKHWKYIEGKMNPADFASRGCTAGGFVKCKLWKNGPSFLIDDFDTWPSECQPDLDSVSTDSLECKKEEVTSLAVLPLQTEFSPILKLFNASSSWLKTKINVASFLRLKKSLHLRQWINGTLSYGELKTAELAIFQGIQQLGFGHQLNILRTKENGKGLKLSDPLIKLNPFIGSDGLMRVGGRQCYSTAPYDTRHPIILPKDYPVVETLIRDFHQNLGHLGRESVLASVRSRFWIIGASSMVRRMLRNCVICRRVQGRPNEQIMADLPEERLSVGGPPFSCTGLDCFGPLIIQRARGTEKRYGLVFTCMTSRAIHLEMLSSLSSDSFICAFRRFVARRGNVRKLFSDNATNFVGASKELRTVFDSLKSTCLELWCREKNIEWKFNTPLASHHGGVWEREIRTVKKILESLMRMQPIKLTNEVLGTLLCEVENIMNNRPLTALSDDPGDLEPLTPNHLLLLGSGETFPPGLFSRDDLSSRQRWKQVQYLANQFWVRFRREYVSLLQTRQRWTKKRRSFEVGDLVLLTDQNLPRNLWSIGRILAVKKDRKGYVRSATVKVSKHKTGKDLKLSTATFVRPITKLILLKEAELSEVAANCSS